MEMTTGIRDQGSGLCGILGLGHLWFPGKTQQVRPTCCCQTCARGDLSSWLGGGPSVLDPLQVKLYHRRPGPGRAATQEESPSRLGSNGLTSALVPSSWSLATSWSSWGGGGFRASFGVLIAFSVRHYLLSWCPGGLPSPNVSQVCPGLRPARVRHHMHYQRHSDRIAALPPLKPLASRLSFKLTRVSAFYGESARATCVLCCAAACPASPSASKLADSLRAD